MLTLSDPLAEREVTITIRVLTGTSERATRPVLLTVGVEGMLPVMETGNYSDIHELTESAWRAFQLKDGGTHTGTDLLPSTPATSFSPETGSILDLF